MTEIETRRVLWENISALMRDRWGGENLTRLAREAKIGPATASRLKAQQTSVGVDIIDRIADLFGHSTWQLLVPGLDPQSPPVLMPVTQAERDLYLRLLSAAREFKGHNG